MAPCPGCPGAVTAGERAAQGTATWAGGGGFPLGWRATGLGWTMKIINGWPTQTPEAVPGTQKAGAPNGAAAAAAAAAEGGMLSCGGEGRRGGEVLWTAGGALRSSGAGGVVAAAPPGPLGLCWGCRALRF